MSVEERLLKLEEFASDVRNFTKVLVDMMQRYDTRMDETDTRVEEHAEMFREANHAIAALADAQIRTEDALKKIIGRLDEDDKPQG